MGRHFTAASNERVYFGSTGLNGFTFTYGTFACWMNVTNVTVDRCIYATNTAAARVSIFLTAGPAFDYYDGSSADGILSSPAVGTTCLFGTTKTTGTTTVRGHFYVPATNTWTHSNFTNTAVDATATTEVVVGAGDNTGAEGWEGDLWKLAWWNKLVMTDSEFERLAKNDDWSFFQPTAYIDFADAEEVGDVTRTLGRYPMRQTARTGTTRGTLKRPPGFAATPIRRR